MYPQCPHQGSHHVSAMPPSRNPPCIRNAPIKEPTMYPQCPHQGSHHVSAMPPSRNPPCIRNAPIKDPTMYPQCPHQGSHHVSAMLLLICVLSYRRYCYRLFYKVVVVRNTSTSFGMLMLLEKSEFPKIK